MGPIEVLWISLLIVFALIGLARGFPRELGVTVMLLVAILVLWLLDTRLAPYVNRVFAILHIGAGLQNFVRFNLYFLFLLFILWISYTGVTLSFPGKSPPGMVGNLLDLFGGLLNGYLFLGTVWYYLNKFNYGKPVLNLITLPLTSFAQWMLTLLPQNVLAMTFNPMYILLGLIIVLLILRVLP